MRALSFVAALLIAGAALAGAFWDATWAGGGDKDQVQLIIAGDAAIGFFWRGDYVPEFTSSISADGKIIAIVWSDGRAEVVRNFDDSVTITVREPHHEAVTIPLSRDQ